MGGLWLVLFGISEYLVGVDLLHGSFTLGCFYGVLIAVWEVFSVEN